MGHTGPLIPKNSSIQVHLIIPYRFTVDHTLGLNGQSQNSCLLIVHSSDHDTANRGRISVQERSGQTHGD